MAIKVDIQNSKFGVPFQGAYFRILNVSISRGHLTESVGKFSVTIDVSGYATEPRDNNTREVDFRRYRAPYSEIVAMPGDNVVECCYKWVMEQSDMQGAVRV